jgi:hypothetical protein
MAFALHALPVRYSPAGLVVAMAAPTDRHAIGELRRAARVDVLATVARVSELRAALHLAYPDGSAPATLEIRESEPPILELVNVRKPGRSIAEGAEGYLGSTRGAERVEARHVVGPRTASEDDEGFVPLVRTKPVAASTRPPFGGRRSVTANFERPSSLKKKSDGDVVGGPEAWAKGGSGPSAVPPSPGPPRAQPTSSRSPPSQSLQSRSLGSGRPQSGSPAAPARLTRPSPTAGALPPSRPPVDPPAAAPPTPPSSPARAESARPARASSPAKPAPKSIIPPEHAHWDLEPPANKVDASKLRSVAPPGPRGGRPAPIGGIVSAIRATRDRDEVVALACQGALTVSRTAVLLALRKSVLKGWDGAGGGHSRDAVRNLWIPTQSPSVFRDVVAHAEPYRGAHGTTAADGLFRAALGSRGGELVVQPVRVGGKVVAVLAADDLRHGDEGVERIEILARAVGEALERIIVDKRR